MRNALDKVVENVQTHILCSASYFRKGSRFCDNVGNYGTAGKAADDNITRRMHISYWIIGYKHTLRICNI
jgi:hypothetical protein